MRSARDSAQGDARRFRRLLRALAIVVGLVLACCAVDAVLRLSQPSAMGDALGIGAGAEDFPSRDTASTGPAQAELPEGFESEVLDLTRVEGLRVAAGGTVIGFSLRGDAPEAFAQLSVQLQARGWLAVESGRPDCGSFVKGEGTYTWLFVSCSQVGDGVSVVLQCPKSGAS